MNEFDPVPEKPTLEEPFNPGEFTVQGQLIRPVPEQQTMASKWKEAVGKWAKETTLSYFSNPAARRDFRVQFRGGKSGWLFTSYLAVLGTVALWEYWRISDLGTGLSDVQSRLQEFYQMILWVLGIVVSLVAPAMAATAIVAEKQRHSLDLVFSTPVKPRCYLIGKIIASYRYVWILLALSVPITSITVLLGGATWWDVLQAYFLLSVQGVVMTSIGLLFSSLTERAVAAVLYTYAGVAVYLMGTGLLGAMTLGARNGVGGVLGEGSPIFPPGSPIWGMNPFTLLLSVGTYTNLWGIPVPNVILATLASILLVRLLLQTAGNMLVPVKATERAKLRLTAAASLSGLLGYVAYSMVNQLSQINGSMAGLDQSLGTLLFWGLAPLVVFMPFLSCYGLDGESRYKPNGWFSAKLSDAGTPASALPFIWLIVGLSTIGVSLGAAAGGAGGLLLPTILALYGLFAGAFWTFFWAVGRLASSYLGGLKVSRTLQFFGVVAVLGAPIPILSALANYSFDAPFRFPWVLYPLSVVMSSMRSIGPMLAHTFLFLAFAALLFWLSEVNYRKRLARRAALRQERNPSDSPMVPG